MRVKIFNKRSRQNYGYGYRNGMQRHVVTFCNQFCNPYNSLSARYIAPIGYKVTENMYKINIPNKNMEYVKYINSIYKVYIPISFKMHL